MPPPINPPGPSPQQTSRPSPLTRPTPPPNNPPGPDPAQTEPAKPADPANAAAAAATASPAATNDTPLKDDLKSTSQFDPTSTLNRSAHTAVSVSRKDSTLSVRQNFMPLFELPVTIAADQRPLGTHIFTAQVDIKD